MFPVIGIPSPHRDRRSVCRGSCEQAAFDVDTRTIFHTPCTTALSLGVDDRPAADQRAAVVISATSRNSLSLFVRSAEGLLPHVRSGSTRSSGRQEGLR